VAGRRCVPRHLAPAGCDRRGAEVGGFGRSHSLRRDVVRGGRRGTFAHPNIDRTEIRFTVFGLCEHTGKIAASPLREIFGRQTRAPDWSPDRRGWTAGSELSRGFGPRSETDMPG